MQKREGNKRRRRRRGRRGGKDVLSLVGLCKHKNKEDKNNKAGKYLVGKALGFYFCEYCGRRCMHTAMCLCAFTYFHFGILFASNLSG